MEVRGAGRTLVEPDEGGIDGELGLIRVSVFDLQGDAAIPGGEGEILELVFVYDGLEHVPGADPGVTLLSVEARRGPERVGLLVSHCPEEDPLRAPGSAQASVYGDEVLLPSALLNHVLMVLLPLGLIAASGACSGAGGEMFVIPETVGDRRVDLEADSRVRCHPASSQGEFHLDCGIPARLLTRHHGRRMLPRSSTPHVLRRQGNRGRAVPWHTACHPDQRGGIPGVSRGWLAPLETIPPGAARDWPIVSGLRPTSHRFAFA